jgi:flavin reductase (DIM6/NTAB) family NADH-FMN oxidoreductase RutF/catechol 2,3-dioxygenase-like lactoylglutathione lyase family enzyme
MSAHGKVEVSAVRHDWTPTPLVEQVVLVTTADADGEPHVAAKSRIAVVSYGPPTYLFFACNESYQTAANVLATRQFVINVPGEDLTAVSWVIGCDPSGRGVQRFDQNGLTRIPGLKVEVPRIAECRAHVECELVDTRQFGPDLAVFGEVVSVSLDERLAEGDERARYRRLAPFFFLDMEWTAALGIARRVEEPVPGPRHDLTVLATPDLERSVRFYARAFDWPMVVEERDFVKFDLPGGRGLALCSHDAFERYTGQRYAGTPDGELTGVEIYLRCEALAHTIARLAAAGARELTELSPRDWGDEAAYFADPDGNVIAVARPLRPFSEPPRSK